MKKKVLVTDNMFRDGYAELMKRYDVTFPPEGVKAFTYEEVLEMIPEYDALQSMFYFQVNRQLMDASPRLKIVSNYAAGYENIDVEYATQRGIQVTNTPDPVTEPTADQAMGLLLATSRRITEIDAKMRKHEVTAGLLNNLGHSLHGATLGILGMGRIGQALAKRAIASGMKIIYNNRRPLDSETEKLYNAKYVSFEELLTTADAISVNAPHTPQTHHMLSDAEFKMMKKSAIVINTARGALIDEVALIKALHEGEIWGAGLDVFEFGDYPMEELLAFDNVVLNPHLGTQTIETRNEMAACVSQNIINFFEGGEIFKVNNI